MRPPAPTRTAAAARRGVAARAAAPGPPSSPWPRRAGEALAARVGLDASEGYFGFRPFAELWVGRLAMCGFATGLAEEKLTGQGILQQIHVAHGDADLGVLLAIGGLASAATLVGLGSTLRKAYAGELSAVDVERYKAFFRLSGEDAAVGAVALRSKRAGDFLSGDDFAAIAAAQAEAKAADAFLGATDAAAVEGAAAALKAGDDLTVRDVDAAASAQKAAGGAAALGPSVSLAAREDVLEAAAASASVLQSLKDVELANGRWAMLGFLAAILVEAGTGRGVIEQCISYLKFIGILGPMSGF